MVKTELIPLSLIRLDGGTQMREKIPADTILEYSEILDELPPPIVYHDGECYWLADGFCRYYAHDHAKRDTIACEVRKGQLLDAFVHSLGANAAHGLRRTNADKRNAVKAALKKSAEAGLGWTDRQIADLCGVNHGYLGDLRKKKVSDSDKKDKTGSKKEPEEAEDHGDYGDDPSGGPPREREPGDDGESERAESTGEATRGTQSDESAFDSLGKPVPKNLRDVFGDPWITDARTLIGFILNEFSFASLFAALKGKARHYPFLRSVDVLTHIDDAKVALETALETLVFGQADVVCPLCDGETCAHCRACGHLPNWRYQEMVQKGDYTP